MRVAWSSDSVRNVQSDVRDSGGGEGNYNAVFSASQTRGYKNAFEYGRVRGWRQQTKVDQDIAWFPRFGSRRTEDTNYGRQGWDQLAKARDLMV
jgi:hypothetical protein